MILRSRSEYHAHARQVFIAAIAVWVGAACRTREASPDMREAVLSRSAYETLPVLDLLSIRPACHADALPCAPGSAVHAVADTEGRLLVWGFGKILYEIAGDSLSPRSVGGIGGGPGEYQVIMAAGFSPSGEVLVFDPAQQRVLRYDRSGRPVETSKVSLPPGFIEASFVEADLRALSVDISERGEKPDSVPVNVFALDTGSAKPRRLSTLPVRQQALAMGDMRPVPRMFAAAPLWQLLPDGQVLYTSGEVLSVKKFDRTGEPVLRFGFDVPPREVTEAEVERTLEPMLRQVPNPQMRGAMRAQAGRAAKRHPGITALRQVENGQIWVREAPRAEGDSVRWVVFDSTGVAVGAVILETESAVLAAARGLILVSHPNAATVSQSLVWMRMRPQQAVH